MTVGQFSKRLLFVAISGLKRLCDSHFRAAEFEATGDPIHHNQVGTRQLHEFNDAQSNGSRTDDKHVLTRLR